MRSKIRRRGGRGSLCIAWGVALALVLTHGGGEALGAVVDVSLVALSSPSVSDVSSSLPTSQSVVAPGSSFHLEVWAQTTHPNGLTSVSLDIAFDRTLATVVSITHTALFSELQNGTIDNASGLVDNLSGSHLGPCADAVGVSPGWSRVAVIEMSALGEGVILLEAAPTDVPAFGTSICAIGDIDSTEVSFGALGLHIIEGNIPAVSEWGLLAMALLVLVAGTVIVPRGQHGSLHPVASKDRNTRESLN